MAGRVMVGGTGYDVKQGRTLIGGTGYDIKQGRTLIGGTGYDIFAKKKEMTFAALMATATSARSPAGRNARTTANVSIVYGASSGTSWTEYLFVFHNGYCSFNKITWNGSELTGEALGGNYTSTSGGKIYINNKTVYVSIFGESAQSVYGATMIPLKFSGYTDAEIAAILGGVTVTRGAGRNSSSTGSITASQYSYPRIAIACCNTEFACNNLEDWGSCTNIYTTYSSYPTLLRQVNSGSRTWGYAHSSSSNYSCYGGSLIFIE